MYLFKFDQSEVVYELTSCMNITERSWISCSSSNLNADWLASSYSDQQYR